MDHALSNLQRVAARAQELDLNTGTFAWLRVGQIYDLKGQRPQAVEAYQRSLRLAPESDAAKLRRIAGLKPQDRSRRLFHSDLDWLLVLPGRTRGRAQHQAVAPRLHRIGELELDGCGGLLGNLHVHVALSVRQ